MEEVLEPFSEEICSEDETGHYGHYDYWSLCERIITSDGTYCHKISVGDLNSDLKVLIEKETKELELFKTKLIPIVKNNNYIPCSMYIEDNKGLWNNQIAVPKIYKLISQFNKKCNIIKGLSLYHIDEMIYKETTEESVSNYIEDFYYPYTLVTENRRLDRLRPSY